MKDKPYIVGVAGGSGSGKTFFLNCFLNHFSPEEVCLISQDDYYFRVGANMTKEENKLHNFDLPTCFDIQKFESDIDKLMNFETVYMEEYTFNNDNLTPKILENKPAPILIIEGLFIYHFENIKPLFDYKIFIDAQTEVALERRLNRDLIERGYSEEDILYKWHNHVMPSYEQYLLPHRSSCDIVIDNSVNEISNILNVTDTISNNIRARLRIVK
ncbi:uridine kinase [Pseudopedobacter saltans DSM 12145]|uniref:Uridine kinase n=1 Tax=Pseudopedobacter saltans (strain ATCC 51119 / DSM 12145 / JCM 21818 / CCUG 39354 / LMG 10337 / NBRC 100064 / NCIMB 13643) TaxID=762903 RepID=F0S572_PSESL|nr:uridine kinase [Pseudopedobacter saltans]ADY50989.1 uridine kinase [Pseudopedobacter saltans DSM 12145]